LTPLCGPELTLSIVAATERAAYRP
jgi:hypothetical protein